MVLHLSIKWTLGLNSHGNKNNNSREKYGFSVKLKAMVRKRSRINCKQCHLYDPPPPPIIPIFQYEYTFNCRSTYNDQFIITSCPKRLTASLIYCGMGLASLWRRRFDSPQLSLCMVPKIWRGRGGGVWKSYYLSCEMKIRRAQKELEKRKMDICGI